LPQEHHAIIFDAARNALLLRSMWDEATVAACAALQRRQLGYSPPTSA
jgi:hypothetical protein